MTKETKNNISCRIFKEQLDVINQLPEEERANVLYVAIMNAFNQFENQNENQFENQNDNQNANQDYLYLISKSLSKISNTICDLLSKNIVWKEYSNNYGGNRNGSGRKQTKIPKDEEDKKQDNNNQGDDFEKEYEEWDKGWVDKEKYRLCYKGIVPRDWEPTQDDWEASNGYPFDVSGLPKRFRFEGKVIKISEKDFDKWKKEFDRLDLESELYRLDCWILKNWKDEQKNDKGKVFWGVRKMLENKQAEKMKNKPEEHKYWL